MKFTLLLLVAVWLAFPVAANASSMHKITPTPTPKPTPDMTKDPVVQRILRDLKPVFPLLTADQIVHTCNEDLRSMYVDMFTKQGIGLTEARQKAALVELKN